MFASTRLTQAALAAASAASLLSPFLYWVGHGRCGWTCYSPISDRLPQPGRLDDLHIGWHVALIPSVGLTFLGLVVLLGLVLQAKFQISDGYSLSCRSLQPHSRSGPWPQR